MTKVQAQIKARLLANPDGFNTTDDKLAKVAKKMAEVQHIYSINVGWKPDGVTPCTQHRFAPKRTCS